MNTPNAAQADRRPRQTGKVRLFREARAEQPLRPYEILLEPDRWSEVCRQRAEALTRGCWHAGSDREVALQLPVAWDEVVADDRTLHFHLHSWTPLGPALSGLQEVGDPRYFRAAVGIALDWVRTHPTVEHPSPFAWYDMAVGVRTWRLAYLLDVAARSSSVPDSVVGALLDALLLHQEVLADELRFPSHSNHGLYFAAGEAAMALRFREVEGMEASLDRARARLERLIHEQFSSEGVHREHSPGYHWMVLHTLEGLLAHGLIREGDHRATLDRIQEATAWFVLPDGHLAPFGDTDRESLPGQDWSHVRSDALRFVLSGGRQGRPPSPIYRGFPASGYVVFRSRWPRFGEPTPEDSYLAQTCAFHSRTHKHADDLSFIWFDRGQEILVDAGRYGYRGRTLPGSDAWKDGFWYADPNRIHVEGTSAHNTVEIDGRNLPRRGADPYGSALMRWGESAGVFYSEAAVRHWGSICHRRVLLLRPGEWLLVFDWLADEESEPHTFVQRFQFAPELEVAHSDVGRLVVTLPREGTPLHLVTLSEATLLPPAQGDRSGDRMVGWISRRDGEMLPAWSCGFRVAGRPMHRFATLLAFGEDTPHPLGNPEEEVPDPDRFRVRWAQGPRTHHLAFRRPTRGPFDLRYRVGFRSAAEGGPGP
jgi:hypothetical protein